MRRWNRNECSRPPPTCQLIFNAIIVHWSANPVKIAPVEVFLGRLLTLVFGTDDRLKFPRFDCRTELRLLRRHRARWPRTERRACDPAFIRASRSSLNRGQKSESPATTRAVARPFRGFAPYIDCESRYGHRASSREARRRCTYMSKRNGNCFARRAYHMSEPNGFAGAVRRMLTPHILDRESAP